MIARGSLRIAVADDEEDLRDYFAEMLPELGHEVTCLARNGRELVESCRVTRPDLIITDAEMPRLDGLAAIAEICRHEVLPAILGSGFLEREAPGNRDERSSLLIAYLGKPFKLSELENAIACVMQRFELYGAAYAITHDRRRALAATRSAKLD